MKIKILLFVLSLGILNFSVAADFRDMYSTDIQLPGIKASPMYDDEAFEESKVFPQKPIQSQDSELPEIGHRFPSKTSANQQPNPILSTKKMNGEGGVLTIFTRECVKFDHLEKSTMCGNDINAQIIYLQNICNSDIDIKFCLQRTHPKDASCGVIYGVKSQEVRSYPSCYTTGNYWYSGRPSINSPKFENPPFD